MTSKHPIIDFIEARLAEDEAAALAAVDSDRPGTHWQWVTTETDTVVAHGDLDEAQEHQPVALRTVERVEYPPETGYGSLPAFLIAHTEEVHAGAGEHIVRHDPARVLREVAAKRRVLAAYRPTGNDPHPGEPCTESIEHDPQGLEWEDAQNWAACERHVKAMQERRRKPFASEHILRYLAAAWSDHPDYRKEWAA